MSERIRSGIAPYIFTAAVLGTAGSGFLENRMVLWGIICWVAIVPILIMAALDKIEFDGKQVRRRGPLAWMLRLMRLSRNVLPLPDIEAITTETISFSFSNGDARLSYRTRISGSGVEFVAKSQRSGYISFIRALFRAAGSEKLDPRSYELFEYFEGRNLPKDSPILRNEIAALPVSILRRLANSLRLTGKLAQASSYFRLAYEKEPRNPELLYEMSRFFHTTAQSEDRRLIQRSDACLRLASRLAEGEPSLLERIGETFFERFDYKRAADCFNRALELEPGRFRSNVGLAEIALRDGKFAHVAHFYSAAAGSDDLALARMARREAEYYMRLASDDDFLHSELRRIRALNQLRWARRLAALVFLFSWLGVAIAGWLSSPVEQFGWALMTTSGLVWFTALAGLHYVVKRDNQAD